MLYEEVEEHFKALYPHAKRMAMFRLDNEWDAEDVVQEAYARCLQYYYSYKGGDFPAWFSIVLINVIRKFKNEQKGIVFTEVQETDFEPVYGDGEQNVIFEDIIDQINKENKSVRDVLTLHFQHGLTAREVAGITDKRVLTVHEYIARFRRKIKDRVK